MPWRMKITPRRFCDSARSDCRTSIASSCLRASEKLLASNSRKALSYIVSSSAFDGATLLAAKELRTSTVIAAIFLIFIEGLLQLSHGAMTSLNFDTAGGKSGVAKLAGIAPEQLLFPWEKRAHGVRTPAKRSGGRAITRQPFFTVIL